MNREDVVSVLRAAKCGPHDHVKPDLIRGWDYERLSATIGYCAEKGLVRAISIGHSGSPHPEYILQGITASGEDYLDTQQLSAASVIPASGGPGNISAMIGFIVALVAFGLPMIGVTVNLYLGAFALFCAFALMVDGFWSWERSSKWHKSLRFLTVGVSALIYFSLVGRQLQVEYRRERARPRASATKPLAPAPVLPVEAPEKAPPHPQQSHKPTRPSARAFASPAPGVAPLTQNCPGGICVGGDNNGTAIVNNYEQPQRTLSPGQRTRLIAALKASGTFTVAVRHSQGSLEAQNYADEIQSALVEAGWIIRQPQFLIQEKEAIGNWVLVPDRGHPTDGASALLESLQSAGVAAQGIEVTGLHTGTFDLVIGLPKKPISP